MKIDGNIKLEIKNLYTNGKELVDILKLFPYLKSSTLYSWVKKENWKSLRDEKISNYSNTPEILMKTLNDMIIKLSEKLDDPDAVAKAADSIIKITKSIKSLAKDKDRLSSVIFTISELSKYINDCSDSNLFTSEFRNDLDRLLSGFQNKMIEKYSPKNFQ